MAKTSKSKRQCFICGKECVDTNYYNTNSEFFKSFGKIPYCKHCLETLYQQYCEKYKNENVLDYERKAVKRMCMALDIFYTDAVYNSAVKQIEERKMNASVFMSYMRQIQLRQYNSENYDTTFLRDDQESCDMSLDSAMKNSKIDEETIKFFGTGFSDDDYEYLKREYDDWTARHECQTKAQEEVFKRICFKQLEILKATRLGEDTKNLDDTFQKLLDTAKLQPKQNSGDTTSETQTFGTLIDKWENTRPIPEIDEELKDVDKIGLYIDTFFKGHTCKMLNEKNAFSNLYSSMMKKFTVNKPEYESDEDYDSEVTFDKMFGRSLALNDSEGVV